MRMAWALEVGFEQRMQRTTVNVDAGVMDRDGALGGGVRVHYGAA